MKEEKSGEIQLLGCRSDDRWIGVRSLLTCLLHGAESLLEKLTGLQLVKKFPAFHGTRSFITALTSVCHLSLSWTSPIQSIYPHPNSWRSCCAMFPLETPFPPGDPSGGEIYLRIVLSPEQASHMWVFLNRIFVQGGVVSTSPIPKLEDYPSSAVRDCLFNLFAATLLIGGRSSIRNLRTRHALVTRTHCLVLNTDKFSSEIPDRLWRVFPISCSMTLILRVNLAPTFFLLPRLGMCESVPSASHAILCVRAWTNIGKTYNNNNNIY